MTMISIPNPLIQLKSLGSSMVFIIVITSIILGLVLWAHISYDIPLVQLTGDITSTLEVPFYIGFESQIGIFFWAASAAVCFYTADMIGDSEKKMLLFSFGLLSLWLGLDDLFMLHETVLPSIGIHQKVVVLSYGVFMGIIFLKFYKIILLSDYLLLGAALGLFAISIFIDNFILDASEYVTKFAEDGTKFIGIVCWFVYLYRTNHQSLVFSNQNK